MLSQDLLVRISLFAELTPPERAALCERSVIQNIPKNTILFSEGDHSDSLYLILSGVVKVYASDEDGKEALLNMLGPDEYFGELAILDEEPRSASVMTLEPCRLLIIKRHDFLECLQRNSAIAISLLQVLSRRLRLQTDNTKNLVLLGVYQRFVKLLYELAQEQNGELAIDGVSHKSLADRVYASREMITLIIKELKAGDYIETDRKRIVIKKRLPAKW